MAEILVAARDLPSGYERGDPIAVRPNNAPWGRAEGPPDFYVIKITNLNVDRARQFLEPLTEPARNGDPEYLAPDPEDRIRRVHRRRVRLVLDDLDTTDRADLAATGRAETSMTRTRAAIRQLETDPTTRRPRVSDRLEVPAAAARG
jgi:hypothetical protein